MPLIDGIGDEVVHFAAVVVVLAVAALAWWSTNARPDRYRTVLLMRPHAHHPVTLSIRTSGAPPPTMVYTNRQSNGSGEPTTDTVTVTSATNTIETPSSNNDDVVPLQEMDSIVDADMALLDNNRLHFYRRVNAPRAVQTSAESSSEDTDTQEDLEPASNAQIREMDSIVSAMEADVATNCDVFSRPNANGSNSNTLIRRVNRENKEKKHSSESEGNNAGDSSNVQANDTTDVANVQPNMANIPNDRKILIKLKFLNDSLKEVEGSLDELLKDFKWRHFSTELTSSLRVRLIFNGRVLGDEAATLSSLGLYHRAVVHCLVHPQRGTVASPPTTTVREGGRAAPERAWDLENILMTLVSVALTVVWFFRCEYSNMFTASASVALFGLTVFYSVAIFGLYLSDTFQFDRRQPPPIPNN